MSNKKFDQQNKSLPKINQGTIMSHKYCALTHSFNVEMARKCGVNAAIVYHHIAYWITANRKTEKAQINGKIWMYESIEEMADFFGYLSSKEIRLAIKILIDAGLIIKDNFNENPFNRTCWYTIDDQEDLFTNSKKLNDLPVGANAFVPGGKSDLPVGANVYIVNKNIKEELIDSLIGGSDASHDNQNLDEVKEKLIVRSNAKNNVLSKPVDEIKADLLKEGFSIDEITWALDEVKEKNTKIKSNILNYLKQMIKNKRKEDYAVAKFQSRRPNIRKQDSVSRSIPKLTKSSVHWEPES